MSNSVLWVTEIHEKFPSGVYIHEYAFFFWKKLPLTSRVSRPKVGENLMPVEPARMIQEGVRTLAFPWIMWARALLAAHMQSRMGDGQGKEGRDV